jgi:hypothetical protein
VRHRHQLELAAARQLAEQGERVDADAGGRANGGAKVDGDARRRDERLLGRRPDAGERDAGASLWRAPSGAARRFR